MRKKQAILVEGYMDVISAHNHGVTNVVASLGTAYTRDHGHILMRQAEEIVLAYDMDGAGRQAAARAIELLLKYGLLRCVSLPCQTVKIQMIMCVIIGGTGI